MYQLDEKGIFAKARDAIRGPAALHVGNLRPAKPTDGKGAAGLCDIEYKGARSHYAVRIKPVLHSAGIPLMAAAKEHTGRQLLLVTCQVSSAQGRALQDVGIQFMDAAGNCYLDFPGFYMLVSGRKGDVPVVQKPARQSLSSAAVRLVFHYLTDRHLDGESGRALIDRPYREISQITRVSLGSVTATKQILAESGFMTSDGTGVRLVRRPELLERWVAAYAEHVRHKLVVGRYRAAEADWWTAATLPKTALWGGEAAAARLTGYLKPEVITIYRFGDLNRFILQHDLRMDHAGKVEILDAFWSSPDLRQGDCVHPLLVYADLIASGIDRNIETAKTLYDRHLRQIIETA